MDKNSANSIIPAGVNRKTLIAALLGLFIVVLCTLAAVLAARHNDAENIIPIPVNISDEATAVFNHIDNSDLIKMEETATPPQTPVPSEAAAEPIKTSQQVVPVPAADTAQEPSVDKYEKLYKGNNIYQDTMRFLDSYRNRYPGFVRLVPAGKSTDGRELQVLVLGKGEKKVFINAATHAREYITTLLVLKQIEYLADAYDKGISADGYDVRGLLDNVSIWFMPIVNPDGVELCTNGIKSVSNPVLAQNVPGTDFLSWKANLRGVDLNRNFDAEWGMSADRKAAPFSAGYPGGSAFSEKETQVVKSFCEQYRFDSAVAYHSAGEILYWYYNQGDADTTRDYNLARLLGNSTGYSLVSKQSALSDPTRGGGFKDWFIDSFKKPAFTIEVGKGAQSRPVDFSEFNAIWEQNRTIPLRLASNVK